MEEEHGRKAVSKPNSLILFNFCFYVQYYNLDVTNLLGFISKNWEVMDDKTMLCVQSLF